LRPTTQIDFVGGAAPAATGHYDSHLPAGHFPAELQSLYEIREWKHASAILRYDFPREFNDVLQMLETFRLKKSWIVAKGGNRTDLAAWVDEFLGQRGWEEKKFTTAQIVDDTRLESPTHKVDCYRNRIAFELEWNNKDPFFDRDLNNFRLLFDLRAISVGIIFTRCDELQNIFNDLDKGSSYGNSTTHMSKLLPRIEGRGGGGCPIIAIGMRASLFREDE
jgi:Restriction endonuclease BglII